MEGFESSQPLCSWTIYKHKRTVILSAKIQKTSSEGSRLKGNEEAVIIQVRSQ
jgi:hypothetical protein